MRALLGCVGAAGLICLAVACGSTDPGEDAAGDATGEQAGNAITLTLQFDSSVPTVGQNKLLIDLADASGSPIAGATVTVDPQMPHHGHGSTETPVISDKAGGKYEAFPVTFQMPGMWEVTVTATHGQMTGNKKLMVTVQ